MSPGTPYRNSILGNGPCSPIFDTMGCWSRRTAKLLNNTSLDKVLLSESQLKTCDALTALPTGQRSDHNPAMAGVISTATWVDGRFMERNVNIEAILSGNTVQDGIKLDIDKPPNVGLLTQTVIQSPISNWILPARLGNVDDHDVVFIGVSLNMIALPWLGF